MVENVAPRHAWDRLKSDPEARLVDVRTEAEWNFVGVPDLGEAGKEAVLIPWQGYPDGRVNGRFVEDLRAAGVAEGAAVFFLCRSGGRSLAAARAAEAAGYKRAFNVAGGFEGPQDEAGHRGGVGGWKAEGLAWRQG